MCGPQGVVNSISAFFISALISSEIASLVESINSLAVSIRAEI
jgi:hypothetical protein